MEYMDNLQNFKQDFVLYHRVSGVPHFFFRTTLLPSPPSCKQLHVKICLMVNIGGQEESYPPRPSGCKA